MKIHGIYSMSTCLIGQKKGLDKATPGTLECKIEGWEMDGDETRRATPGAMTH